MIKTTRALYFPYALQQLDDKSWVILDRNYKPMGFGINEFVNYEEYIKPEFRIKSITAAQASRLSCESDPHHEGLIYLYTDSCTPTSGEKRHMEEYLKRLVTLMKLKLKAE